MAAELSALRRYLRLITADAGPDRFVEIRYRRRRGMGQRFLPAGRLDQLEAAIGTLARTSDTYVGVLARDRPNGGRHAVPDGRLVWVEVDALAAHALLERAPAPPTLTVASGTPGHLHAYWRLSEPASGEAIEVANRKLAQAVGGDFASVDRARILRPPDTLNYKSRPPRAVTLESLEPQAVHDLERLVFGLRDPKAPSPATARSLRAQTWQTGDGSIDDELRAIPAGEYAERLSGRVPDRDGKLLCPFHEERTPSLQLYPDGSWCCFGCRQGGSIVDFAAAAWGMGTKGRDFIAVRERLIAEFLDARPRPPRRRPTARRRMPVPTPSTNREVSR